ncbi:MAG: penicillin-binding transpeptidase domain-containing protein [Pseudomonadales bacterium]|nr:penicillin-binding transpeptidase domain-containing protein [Pseudomonadales bacterium]
MTSALPRNIKARNNKQEPFWRLYFVFVVILVLVGVLIWKIFSLQISNNDFLQLQGNARTVRNDVLDAHRGIIMDRNGEPLAISTPVLSLWLNPKEVLQAPERWPEFFEGIEKEGINSEIFRNRIIANASREFLYIKRRIPPADAQKILDLKIPGVYSREEYRRYYPLGEVAAHIVGLTDADDAGQEGLELSYDDWLKGKPGSKQVLKDRRGGIIRDVKTIAVAEPGNNLELSIDSRIQTLTYKALKEEVTRRRAKSGTAIVLDAVTGEVLAMASQPSYNPNNRATVNKGEMRNRAIVDLLEPGSTVKTFTVTAALESGLFDTSSIIDTNPGSIRIDRTTIRDPVNYGLVSLEKIITKSSQVGASRLGLGMGEVPMLDVLSRVGFGQPIGSGFPGEASGILPSHERWSKADIASMAYGYGFQVSPLQLAQAYMIYANGGIKKPVSFLKHTQAVSGQRVVDEKIVRDVVSMLETVVDPKKGGTGTRAYLPFYRVAGKTGTAWYYDVAKGGYDNQKYISLFAGFIPVTEPRIVVVVTINEPQGEEYGGGQIAAPVFARIAAGAMRILNVPPDQITTPVLDLSLLDNTSGKDLGSGL